MEKTTLKPMVYLDEETGLQYYLVEDPSELDPNGEPVIYEVTATQYTEILSSQN